MPVKFSPPQELLAKADERGMRRVLIVTALPLELAAVRARLTHLGSVLTKAGRVFEFAQFSGSGQEWLVVTGESGAEVLPASLFVTSAISEFGPFELILFVGVAASRKPSDAPIGSVMVSRHVYLGEVGKYAEGAYFSRARMLRPNQTLLGLSQKIARDGDWLSRINPPYAGRKPGDEHYPEPFPPTAIICPIVSVNSVSADPASVLEEQIQATYQDATGLEMEGYGALAAAENEQLPCIVVRGVSDIRKGKDPEIDKIHQPVAAGHATAFALELLDTWGVNVTGPTPKELANLAPTPTDPPLAVAHVEPQPTVTHTEAQSEPEPDEELDDSVSARVSIVVHLRGDESDYPPERQTEILQAIKNVTGDPTAEIISTQSGSFHLFVSLLRATWERLEPDDVVEKLSTALNLPMDGVSSEDDFRAFDKIRKSLLAASKPLLNWPQTLPDGRSLERPELNTLTSTITRDEGTTTALLGLPGSGKTALLAKFAEQLRDDGTPFLAVKADLLDPSVETEDDLRTKLDLPEIPSLILTRLARVKPVVLIVDQLDALASYLDLRTGRLNALLNLIRKVGGQRNIHIILSARTFEFEHDVRLRTVQAESLQLELPGWSAVLAVLQANGVKAEGWPDDAKEELRSPQALVTYLKLSESGAEPSIVKYHAMLEQLWRQNLLTLPNGAGVVKLAGEIAEEMADRETLWIASARYDDRAKELAALIANNIVRHPPDNPATIGFSHQTVFDFALARSFTQIEGSLHRYVLSREASLFIRPKLWSALTYLRGAEPQTYEDEVRALWKSPDLRAHLRFLLIEFLGQQNSPTDAEAVIFQAALSSENRQTALQSMLGSVGWFKRVRDTDVAAAMLKPEEAPVATGILMKMADIAQDDVLHLLEQKWRPRSEFDSNMWSVLQETAGWKDRHLALAKEVLSRTNIAPYALSYLIGTIGVEHPAMATQLVRYRLDAQLAAAKVEAERRAAIPKPEGEAERITRYREYSPTYPLTHVIEHDDGWDGLEALAKNNPKLFLDNLWPWFKTFLETLELYSEEEPDVTFPLHHGIDLRFPEEGTLDLPEHAITGAFRVALEVLAETDEEVFRVWFSEHQSEEWEPAQRLLANALTHEPKRYAALALEFLLSDTRRFCLGHIQDSSETSTLLVAAVSPHWDNGEVDKFVQAVTKYSKSPAEWRDADSRRSLLRYIERTKLSLLRALPENRLIAATKSYVEELRRRFGDDKQGVQFSGTFWVGSPMSAKEMSLASDDDIINAFRELPDKTGWDNPKNWTKGGNIQLARELAEYSKTDPSRAVEVILRLSPEMGTRAAGYVLDAMAEEADPQLVVDTLKTLEQRGYIGEEYRGSVARGIERLLRRDYEVTDDVLNILIAWLAAPAIDIPSEEEAEDAGDDVFSDEKESSSDDDGDHPESVLWGNGALTVLPQGNYSVLEAITRVLLNRKDSVRLLKLLTEHLDRDEDAKVWESLSRFFRYIRPEDMGLLTSFLSKLMKKYPQLYDSREVAVAFAYLHWIIPDFIKQVLDVWKDSPKPRVQLVFGEILTLVWIMQPKLGWPDEMMKYIFEMPAPHARTGAAFAAAYVWAEGSHPDKCSELLVRILKMHEPQPFSASLDIFRVIDRLEPSAEWSKFLNAVIDEIPQNASFPSTFIIERLQSLLPHEAELVGRFALALTAKWNADLADIRTETALASADLVDIAITLHRLGPDTREVGTKLFERLIYLNAYKARDTLNQIDNRFPDYAPTQRPRLPHRQRTSRRRRRAK